jgi:hypothetical protein
MTDKTTRPAISLPSRRRTAEPAVVQNLLRSNRAASDTSGTHASGEKDAEGTLRDMKPVQVTYYMPSDGRSRAKAAFLATSGREGDRSWSEFVTRAVLMEVERRERIYNEGEEFPRSTGNLAPGRKLQ